MKSFFAAPAFLLLAVVSISQCNDKKTNAPFKARLETKALCMNYTFTLLQGSLDTSKINATWTDETTGKTFTNAFGIANPCSFPSTINAGDEFYFTIDSVKKQDCAVCMAYYPTPSRKLYINVVPKP